MDNLVGKQIGKYRVVRRLGHGGFGKVYQAKDIDSSNLWAIKIPLEQYLMDPEFRERFIREVQTPANLNHVNIVPISDKGQQGELLYYVMPFYKNGTLENRIKGRSLPLDEVERYLAQMCSALDYLHTQKVAHLDFKPANLLIDDDGHLRLADFGLARLAVQGKLVGGTSLQFGTAKYMAPEQIHGNPCFGSDIYALGITLYQMLTGHVPFDGKDYEIKNKHINQAPPPLRHARPDLLQALQQVLEKALAKNSKDRYQSASDLLVDFKAACSGYIAQPFASKATNPLPAFSLDPSLVKGAGVAALGGGAVYLAITQKFDKLLLVLALVGVLALMLSYEMGNGEAGPA